jgi:hypothetical protein
MHKIGMTTRARTLVLSLFATFAVAAPADAASPALLGVGHKGLHPTAALSAPGADDVTVYISKRPDRATDGNFLTENSAGIDFLTADEIASGAWMDEDNLDPGTYYVMLQASTYSCPDGADCTDGFSNVMTLLMPKPKQRFRASIKSGFIGSFTLTITPAGKSVPYRLCWTRGRGRRCERGTVDGYDWTRPASDTIFLTLSDLKLPRRQKQTTFTWQVAGKRVASKTIRIARVLRTL